jgi:adenine-specific DNA-methyltransferase
LLQEIINNTQKYIEGFPKEERKEIGQFFTSIQTAQYMASKVETDTRLKILDVGAGTGILSAAVLEKLLRSKKIKNIELTLYENDKRVIAVLDENLQIMQQQCATKNINLIFRVIKKNFILENRELWKQKAYVGNFDIVISNPPYKKIGKEDAEAKAMEDIVYGQPNIYYLCMAMSSHLLKKNGQFIFIVPRSWTSGLYFKYFREYFLGNICLKSLHLFVSRDKVFDAESVLQETMIIFGMKSSNQTPRISITTSNGTNDFHKITKLFVKSKMCITGGENHYVLLPVCDEDIDILTIMANFKSTLQTEGYVFKTGQVVEFRNKEDIKLHKENNCVPLIRPFHLYKGFVKFPVNVSKGQYMKMSNKKSLFMEYKDMLLIKRFTTKEETRRLQPALLLVDNISTKIIAVENHVNYLDKTSGQITKDELFGIWALFSSQIWDKYYRILNGSTQVNATEINTMPIPDIVKIREIGQKIQQQDETINFDNIIKGIIYGKDRRNERDIATN